MQAYISGPMKKARRYWRMSLIRGIVAIVFGLLAIFWPHLTFRLFFYVFGVFAIVEGFLVMVNGFSQRRTSHQQATTYRQGEPFEHGRRTTPMILVLEGLLTLICGILALVLPGIAAILAVYAVAAWALFKGIGSLMQIRDRGWVMGLIGILAIILALILFLNPIGAIRSFLWIVGVFSLIMGIVLVARAIHHRMTAGREVRPLEPGY